MLQPGAGRPGGVAEWRSLLCFVPGAAYSYVLIRLSTALGFTGIHTFPFPAQNVDDPAVMVSFPLVDDAMGASLIAWTTTPWTLPSNLALCVHPEFIYVRVSGAERGGKQMHRGEAAHPTWHCASTQS